jgi:large subunit ribosomal protein L17
MKKAVFGRKFKRDKNERKALFKSLMSALVMSERIQTTEAKAKAIRPEIEKLITKAKENTNASRLVLQKSLTKEAMEKILKSTAPRFANRQGGYVRLIKYGKRFGDNAPAVVMEWTEVAAEIVPAIADKVVEKRAKKEAKPVKKAVVKKTVKKAVKKTK